MFIDMMDNKKFKQLFNDVARLYDFEQAYGAWFLESPECIVVLELQKSYFGNYYELNIKSFVQGAFGNHYVKSKDLAKGDMGRLFDGNRPNTMIFLILKKIWKTSIVKKDWNISLKIS